MGVEDFQLIKFTLILIRLLRKKTMLDGKEKEKERDRLYEDFYCKSFT